MSSFIFEEKKIDLFFSFFHLFSSMLVGEKKDNFFILLDNEILV